MCFGIIYMIENSWLIDWWLSDWLIETLEAVIRSCSSKYVFLKISQISQENTCVGVLWGLQLYQKETPTQMVSCEIYKIFRNTFLQNTSSDCFWHSVFWNYSMRCTFVFQEQKIIQYHISLCLIISIWN